MRKGSEGDETQTKSIECVVQSAFSGSESTMSLFSASLARRQHSTEPLGSTTDPTVAATAVPHTPITSPSVTRSAIPPTTAQSERGTPTSLPTSISLPTSLVPQYPQLAPSRPLVIGLIVACAVILLILLPCFTLHQLRRTRFRPRHGNVDLLAHSRDSAHRRRGGSGRVSHESSSRRGPARTLVDFLSFGSIQDSTGGTRSYFSGTTSLSDPPPAYNLHPRASAVPSYRSRSESLRPTGRRQTRVPITRLPTLRLVVPEGDEGWPSESDQEQKSEHVDPETPATYTSSPSTGGRTEKR